MQSITGAVTNVFNDARKEFDEQKKANEKARNDAKETLKKEEDDLAASVAARTITYEEYQQRRNEINKQAQEKESEEETLATVTKRKALKVAQAELQKQSEVNWKSFDETIKKASASTNDFGSLLKTAGEASSAVFSAMTTDMAAMVANGTPFLQALVKSVFHAVRAMAAAFQAQILAREAATTGIFGLPSAFYLMGLVQVAISAAEALIGFKRGGYTGDGSASDAAGIVHKREYVMNESITQRERGLLDFLHKGGTSQDWFVNKYGRLQMNVGYESNTSELTAIRMELVRIKKFVSRETYGKQAIDVRVSADAGFQAKARKAELSKRQAAA
jgi:hypothetical protein